MIAHIKNSILHISRDDVIAYARDRGMNVSSIEDFRNQAGHYNRIENVMEDYRGSHARYSALGGLTTGFGGFATSITFAGIDTLSLSIQLYRLAQQFAVLNGFDGNDPLHKDKMLNIYFEALGINAFAQAALKHQLLKAGAKAEAGEISESIFLKLIARVAKAFGKNLSSEEAGRLVPVFGGFVGASVNYSFARKTSGAMKKAYRRAYFNAWHDEK